MPFTAAISSTSSSRARPTISLLQRVANWPSLVEHVRDAARHAGREVAAGRPEHHHPAAGHVLAAVIADALDHRVHAGVAHAEPLAREAADVRLAGGRAVERDVADDDVLLRHEGRVARRIDDDLAAREPLADVVVRVALEHERHARGTNAPKLWPAEPLKWSWIVSSGRPAAP